MITITSKPCPDCRETIQVNVAESQLAAYNAGAHIQYAFSNMDADTRERFITGYCSPCWDKLFGKED